MRSAFQTFGAFTSGIGIHYAPSAIVATTHQVHAPNLVVGRRMLPHVFVRAADARPFEIQDLLPADTRFKLLVFAGDTSDAAQLGRVRALADAVGAPGGFYRRFGGADPARVFDVLAVCSVGKEKVNYTDLPPLFRTHWSKVLLDDKDMFGRTGGGGYEKYGIDKTRGAVVVVRPDGYVGLVAPYESVADIDAYFAGFMKA